MTGLGARGLVYHAWLGQLLAEAVVADDEALLPQPLTRWKRTKEALKGSTGRRSRRRTGRPRTDAVGTSA